MTTQTEALKLEQEALEKSTPDAAGGDDDYREVGFDRHNEAIAAIREALAQSALDKMAENARELGLDYEPAPVLYQLPDDLYDSKDWKVGSYAERVEWLHTMYEAKKRELEYCLDAAPVQEPVGEVDYSAPGNVNWLCWKFLENKTKLYTTPPAAPAQEPIKWTNKMSIDVPNQQLYTTPPNVATPLDETASLAAQDLQTELEATNRQVEILSDALAESRREVAALKAVQEQPVLIPASLADKQFERYYRQGYDAGFAAQRQSEWVGLSHDEFRDFASTFEYGTGGLIRAIEAKLKEKNK